MVDAIVRSQISPRNLLLLAGNKTSNPSEAILPWLCSIKSAIHDFYENPNSGAHLQELLEDCIRCFENEEQYRNDIRFLQVWILYADTIQDFGKVFRMLEEKKIFLTHSLLNAEPLENLQKMHASFLDRMHEIVDACSLQQIDYNTTIKQGNSFISPWSGSTTEDLLKKIEPHILKYKGYHRSAKAYSGKVPLSSLRNSSRNKVIELGGKKYQIKGCSGQGGFARVFKAHVDNNPDDVVALKIQVPAFPWEFYMYRQLDNRIPYKERPSFGFAHKMHVYSDCSILVCDYVAHGTLQDAINSFLVLGQSMEEVLCIYYSIEMLRILETLHHVGIIHGDFKPDNLLVRFARDDLTEDGFRGRTGSWQDQGLCLVDWGKGIDLSLFPDGTEFKEDCNTSGFRCVEMQENRPWVFQVDTYGLCVIVHMMLHGTYMSVEKKAAPDGSYCYQPKSSLKRYWNVDLWSNLFTKLLNISSSSENDVSLLWSLRQSFEDYLCESPQLIKKLKMVLAKQRTAMCS